MKPEELAQKKLDGVLKDVLRYTKAKVAIKELPEAIRNLDVDYLVCGTDLVYLDYQKETDEAKLEIASILEANGIILKQEFEAWQGTWVMKGKVQGSTHGFVFEIKNTPKPEQCIIEITEETVTETRKRYKAICTETNKEVSQLP
jgi:hypothetical protein